MADGTDDQHWIGFDLGGTKMLSTVFNGEFKKLGKHRTKTRGHEGSAAGIRRMINTIHQSIEDAGSSIDAIRGIGIGCPGPLDLNRGILEHAPNLGWEKVPIKDMLAGELNCPVHILNDVDAGVYGEYRFGAAIDHRTALGVFPGTGIGGGCVYEGSILRGAKTSCMEIGHIQVMPEGPLCGCGRRGCLEAVASRLVVASRAAAAAFRGQAPHLLANQGTDLSRIRSGALAESIRSGDQVIDKIVREAARHIGRAVASVVHLLAPDVIVLGGGMVEAMPELFVSEIKNVANARVLPNFSGSFKVVTAQLGDSAGVLGAAAWAEYNATTGQQK